MEKPAATLTCVGSAEVIEPKKTTTSAPPVGETDALTIVVLLAELAAAFSRTGVERAIS